MRTIDLKLFDNRTDMATKRVRFRIRMWDGEVLADAGTDWVVQVPNGSLDGLIDALIHCPGVRSMRTRPVV